MTIHSNKAAIFAKALAASLAFLLLFVFSCSDEKNTEKQTQDKSQKAVEKQKEEPKYEFPKVMPGEVEVSLSEADKAYLLKVARQAFDLWVTKKERLTPADIPADLKSMRGNNVFATIYKSGDWRGCVSSKKKTLVPSVIGAVINTCNDKRFKNPEPGEEKDFRVELSILGPKTLVDSKDLGEIDKQLEPGVHGIYVKNKNGRAAFFLPYVFVKKQRTLETWLDRITKKAGLPKGAWRKGDTAVYRFKTINFIEDKPYGNPADLYRYKVVRKSIDAKDVIDSLAMGRAWFVENMDAEGFLPGLDDRHRKLKRRTSKDEVLALIAIAESSKGLKNKKHNKLLKKRFAELSKSFVVLDYGVAVGSKEKQDLDTTLLVCELIIQSDFMSKRKAWALKFINYLETQFGPEGFFTGKISIARNSQAYATYVLAGLTELTGRKRDREILSRALRVLMSQSSKTGQNAWDIMALVKAYKVLNDEQLLHTAKAHTTKLIQSQHKPNASTYGDFIGAISTKKVPQTLDTALNLKAIATVTEALQGKPDAGQEQMLDALLLGTRFLLEQQFTPVSAFFFKEWKLAQGSFKRDIILNNTSIEVTARALSAIKSAKNLPGGIFDEKIKAGKELLAK